LLTFFLDGFFFEAVFLAAFFFATFFFATFFFEAFFLETFFFEAFFLATFFFDAFFLATFFFEASSWRLSFSWSSSWMPVSWSLPSSLSLCAYSPPFYGPASSSLSPSCGWRWLSYVSCSRPFLRAFSTPAGSRKGGDYTWLLGAWKPISHREFVGIPAPGRNKAGRR
jgi:hypothetical protein